VSVSGGWKGAWNRIVIHSYQKKAASVEAQHRNVRCVLCLYDEETLAYGLFTKALSDIFTLTLPLLSAYISLFRIFCVCYSLAEV